jgi:hypothetical protein
MVEKKGPSARDAGPLKANSNIHSAHYGAKGVRLQYLARRLHALGERPLFEFLTELERGADLHNALERYACLAPLAEFIASSGGDRLISARAIGEARR